MPHRTPFSKPFETPHDLVTRLKSRGLSIPDEHKAEHYLTHIGYYRLSAYMYPLLTLPKQRHIYKAGASFAQVMTLYRFDKKLRLLLFNEIEKIEVAVRSTLVGVGCTLTGDPFWMTNGRHFIRPDKFARTVKLIEYELGHSKEEFIVHFKETYSDIYPPAWILSEVLPFGVLTNIYANLKDQKIRKRVAQSFGLQTAPFESWLTIVTLTRNACCHHARVWNKQNSIRPTIPANTSYPWISLPTDTLRIYFNICIIKYLLHTISPGNDMRAKLQALFTAFPEVDLAALGFPKGWLEEPLWHDPSLREYGHPGAALAQDSD